MPLQTPRIPIKRTYKNQKPYKDSKNEAVALAIIQSQGGSFYVCVYSACCYPAFVQPVFDYPDILWN